MAFSKYLGVKDARGDWRGLLLCSGCCGGQQPFPPSLRARVTLPKPFPLEMWRSWSVGWCSAALATGACRWTRLCPSTASAGSSPTARAEWRVSQVCVCRDLLSTAGGLGAVGGKFIHQGHGYCTPGRVETEEMSCLYQGLRSGQSPSLFRVVWFSMGVFLHSVTEVTQPMQLLSADV